MVNGRFIIFATTAKATKLMQNYNIQEVKSSKRAERSKKLYNKKLC
mgnify:CR=1 FL=1